MEWLKKKSIAHRGLHDEKFIPENTILSFEEAIKKGYGIELDVRITKDKQIVVFHDKNLIRLSNSNKKIEDLDFDELKKFKLLDTNEEIPLLSEVLSLVDSRVPLLIDIKDYGDIGTIERCIYEIIKDYRGELAICSFNPEVVLWFLKYRPNIKRGLIFGNLEKYEIKYHNFIFIYRYLLVRPHFVSLEYKLVNTFLVKICKLFKIPLISWTIKSKSSLEKVLGKVDNIIFENENIF